MMRKKRSVHLQWRYFTSYVLVMLAAMSLLVVYVYQSFYRFHSENLLKNYRNSLQVICDRNENMLSNMVAISSQIITNDGMIPFNYLEEPERMKQYPRRLTAYRATHDEIEKIFLWFKDDPFIYYSDGGNLVDTMLRDGLIVEDVSPEELKDTLNSIRRLDIWPEKTMSGFSIARIRPEQQMLSVFVPVKLESGNRVGTLLYLVNHDVFERWFLSAMPNVACALILSDDAALVQHNPAGIPDDVVEAALEKMDAGDELTSFSWEGKGYQILRTSGNMFSYSYIAVIDDSERMITISASVQMLLIVSAIVAALGMLLIVRVVQSRLKPIYLIRNMLTDTKPTGNELVEIRDNVQQLIDRNQMLAGQMENVKLLKKSDFVRRFLTGSFANQDEYLAMAEDIQLNIEFPFFMVGLMVFPADSVYDISLQKLDHHFDDTVSGAVRVLATERKAVLLVFAQTEDALISFMDRRLEGLRVICPGLTIATSKPHCDYREGQRAYLEADSAFEMRFVRGNADVIMFEPTILPTIDPATAQKLTDRLKQALRNQDTAEVSVALGMITQAMHKMGNSLFDFRCMYNDIFNAISGVATQMRQGEKVYDLFRLGDCLSLDDLDIMLRKVCNELLAEGAVPKDADDIPEHIRQVKELISASFTDPDLSVSSIAERVGVSDSKLSVEFKQAYRQTPLEMITRKRMLLAKEMLLATTLPVKDIAVECGYYDISSFNRRFKAHTGMTPLKYRQEGAAVGLQDGKPSEI